MPLLEFECNKCGERFEVLIARARAANDVACEKCGSTDTTRQLSMFAGRARPDISQAQAYAQRRMGSEQ